MTLAQQERAALVTTARALGPDAPTLCDGWSTQDLIAHLVLRESARLDAVAGILVPTLAARTERLQKQVAAREWPDLLEAVASGPPWYSPFKPIDRFANLVEMFVHHEDVLRAQPGWRPRAVSPQLREEIGRRVGPIARLALKKTPALVSLVTPQGKVVGKGGKGEPVKIIGEAEELVLFAFGREPVTVDYEGTAAAVLAVASSKKGI